MHRKKIYLLDRNVVDLIKLHNNNKFDKILLRNDLKEMLIYLLLNVDQAKNSVTPFLSVVEGQKGRQESSDEKKETLIKEILNVASFFKSAKTDSSFLFQKADYIASFFATPAEDTWEREKTFLCDVLPFLKQTVSLTKKTEVKTQLLTTAKQYEINFHDPVVMICLICLYDENNSSKIKTDFLKINAFLNGETHNLLSDLHVISKIMLVKKEISSKNLFATIEFLTLDKTLDFFIRNIDMFYDEQKVGKISYSRQLFPNLSVEQYDCLFEEIHQNQI